MILILYIAIRVIAFLWALWAGFAIYYTNRLFRKDLEYLFDPDVNLLGLNNSCSRYDPIRVKKWEIYIGSIFLMPLRILICFIMVPPGIIIMKIIYHCFCSNNTYNPSHRQQLPETEVEALLLSLLLAKNRGHVYPLLLHGLLQNQVQTLQAH